MICWSTYKLRRKCTIRTGGVMLDPMRTMCLVGVFATRLRLGSRTRKAWYLWKRISKIQTINKTTTNWRKLKSVTSTERLDIMYVNAHAEIWPFKWIHKCCYRSYPPSSNYRSWRSQHGLLTLFTYSRSDGSRLVYGLCSDVLFMY